MSTKATFWNVTLEALPRAGESSSEFNVRPAGDYAAVPIECALAIRSPGAAALIHKGQEIPSWLAEIANRENCTPKDVLRVLAAELAKDGHSSG